MYDARKEHEKYLKEKAIKENTRKYHTDIIKQWNNKVVATSNSWDYVLHIYGDKSAALYYIAKPESGCKSGQYCGIDILSYHFKDLKKYDKDKDRKSIIPADWIIKESDFFTALNII